MGLVSCMPRLSYSRSPTTPKYPAESSLCADLRRQAQDSGFQVYPEVQGWDLVLVRHGIQIGVQAKLRFNPHLLAQALAPDVKGHGPCYRAVAAPLARTTVYDARLVCHHARLLLLDMNKDPRQWLQPQRRGRWFRRLGVWSRGVDFRHYRWRPVHRLWLPPTAPDIPAGVPSPQVVGQWQLAATRAEALHRIQGHVTRSQVVTILQDLDASFRPDTLLRRFYEYHKPSGQWHLRPRIRPASSLYRPAWLMTRCPALHRVSGVQCRLLAGHEGRHRATASAE